MIAGRSVFIIPGYKHKPNDKAYKKVAEVLKNEGYCPIPVDISWRNTTISQNTDRFLKQFNKIKTREKYILGFSFGAMIAFLASTKVKTDGLILCSLSPFFKEDLKSKKNSISSIQYRDFLELECSKLAKKIKSKQIRMLYGSREAKSLKKRVFDAFDQISSENKALFRIQKAEHNIGDKRYLNKIHQIAKELN